MRRESSRLRRCDSPVLCHSDPESAKGKNLCDGAILPKRFFASAAQNGKGRSSHSFPPCAHSRLASVVLASRCAPLGVRDKIHWELRVQDIDVCVRCPAFRRRSADARLKPTKVGTP